MKRSIRKIQLMVIAAVWKAIDLQETRAIRVGRQWGE